MITVTHTISMGHRLPSYDGVCSSPHGHNLRVEVQVRVPPDVFLDFKLVSGHLAGILAPLDHAMVLHDKDPLAHVLLVAGFRVVKLSSEPTTEALAQYVYAEMARHAHAVVRVTVHETDRYSAETTHGGDVRRVQ
jgi:6-pyruvoyl-tetrahydropterin synthase